MANQADISYNELIDLVNHPIPMHPWLMCFDYRSIDTWAEFVAVATGTDPELAKQRVNQHRENVLKEWQAQQSEPA